MGWEKERSELSTVWDPNRWGEQLAAEVAEVMRVHPEADPEDVRLTLIALQSTPLERLNRSLRRGRGFAAFTR